MAAFDYNRNAVGVTMITWTGSNIEEVVAFVGSSMVQYVNGVLEVNGTLCLPTYKIAKYTAGGAFYGVLSPAHVTANFTQL